MKIYIANIPDKTTEEDLKATFKPFGKVDSVETAKGYAYVEMSTKEEGQAAIDGLNGKELKGKALLVSEAKPLNRSQRRGGGSGFNSGKSGFHGAPGSNRGAYGAGKKSGFPGGKVGGSRRGD